MPSLVWPYHGETSSGCGINKIQRHQLWSPWKFTCGCLDKHLEITSLDLLLYLNERGIQKNAQSSFKAMMWVVPLCSEGGAQLLWPSVFSSFMIWLAFLTSHREGEKKRSIEESSSSGRGHQAPKDWRRASRWVPSAGVLLLPQGACWCRKEAYGEMPCWFLVLKKWRQNSGTLKTILANHRGRTANIITKYLVNERWQENQTLFVKILKIISILWIP